MNCPYQSNSTYSSSTTTPISFADYNKAYDYDKPIQSHSYFTQSTCSTNTTNSSLSASTSSLLSGGAFGDRNQLFSMPVDRSCCSPSPQVKSNHYESDSSLTSTIGNFCIDYLTDDEEAEKSSQLNLGMHHRPTITTIETQQKLKISDAIIKNDAKQRLIQFANTKTPSDIALYIINSLQQQFRPGEALNKDKIVSHSNNSQQLKFSEDKSNSSKISKTECSFDGKTDTNKCFSCKLIRKKTKKCENYSPLEPRSRMLYKKKQVKPKKLDISFIGW